MRSYRAAFTTSPPSPEPFPIWPRWCRRRTTRPSRRGNTPSSPTPVRGPRTSAIPVTPTPPRTRCSISSSCRRCSPPPPGERWARRRRWPRPRLRSNRSSRSGGRWGRSEDSGSGLGGGDHHRDVPGRLALVALVALVGGDDLGPQHGFLLRRGHRRPHRDGVGADLDGGLRVGLLAPAAAQAAATAAAIAPSSDGDLSVLVI